MRLTLNEHRGNMWQAVDPFSDWIMGIPSQVRLVHVGKGSIHEIAALLGYNKNRLKSRGITQFCGRN